MINFKMGAIVIGAFVAGAFLASPELRAYAAATIGSGDIIDGSIQSVDIKDGEVKVADIGNGQVTAPKIKDGEVRAAEIAGNAVTSAKITDGTIAYGDVSRSLIAVEHRDDCNCGGTGWDPDGSKQGGFIYDSRITANSVISTSFTSYLGPFIHCETYALSGHAVVACDNPVPSGAGINYA